MKKTHDNPSPGQVFRVHTEMMALSFSSDRRNAVLIPERSVLEIVTRVSNEDERMVQAVWESQDILVFATDLKDRAKPVTSPQSRQDAASA